MAWSTGQQYYLTGFAVPVFHTWMLHQWCHKEHYCKSTFLSWDLSTVTRIHHKPRIPLATSYTQVYLDTSQFILEVRCTKMKLIDREFKAIQPFVIFFFPCVVHLQICANKWRCMQPWKGHPTTAVNTLLKHDSVIPQVTIMPSCSMQWPGHKKKRWFCLLVHHTSHIDCYRHDAQKINACRPTSLWASQMGHSHI